MAHVFKALAVWAENETLRFKGFIIAHRPNNLTNGKRNNKLIVIVLFFLYHMDKSKALKWLKTRLDTTFFLFCV